MNSLRSLINVGEKIRISSFTSLRGRDVASYVERSNIAIVSLHSPLPWPLKKLPDFACRIGDWKAQIFFFLLSEHTTATTKSEVQIFSSFCWNNFNYVLEHTWVRSNK
jgi:hypothetical protein